MDYWVSPTGEYALWYMISGSNYLWMIGGVGQVGTYTGYMFAISATLEKKCPNSEGYTWDWNFYNSAIGDWDSANNVLIKCANEDDFCTSANPCGLNQGDCDLHDDCQTGLECGSNNCPDSLGFEENEDCCVEASGSSRNVHFNSDSDPIIPAGNFGVIGQGFSQYE